MRFQQTRHRAFRHVDAERAELPVNPRRSPQRICRRHVSNERADGLIDRRTAVRPTFRPSGPSTAKPVLMPAHDGIRVHKHQRHAPGPPASGQDDPKQSVAGLKMRALIRAFQAGQLLAKRQILKDQFPMASERQRQRAGEHDQQLQHAWMVAGISAKINARVLARDRLDPFQTSSESESGGCRWFRSVTRSCERCQEGGHLYR